ncbi:MAG: FadR/GntR family transcriptional regulator [Acidobacteriota bacterium]
MYKTVQPSRLYEQIVDQIEESIRSGSLRPGDQLPAERDLARDFGVSRTAVREAVKALGEKGLVRAYPGRGTFIVDGTSHAVRQSIDLLMSFGQRRGAALAEVREILEPEIAFRAASRAEEKHIAALRDAFRVMDEAAPDNPEAYIEADLDFHLALADATMNPVILALIDSIVGLLREQRLRTYVSAGGPEHGQLHHARILRAIEDRDPDAARLAMQAHMIQVRDDTAASPPPPNGPNGVEP